MNARDDVYRKIHDALGTDDGAAPSREALDALFHDRVVPRTADPVQAFIEKATAAGGEAFRVEQAGDATPWLADFVVKEEISSAICSRDIFDAGIVDHDVLASRCPHLRVHIDGASRREEHTSLLAGIQLGIGTAVAGFADNGAIAIRATASESRALSLLTEIHLAVLHSTDIHGAFADFAEGLTGGAQGSSAVTIVGGPSKTADIEKVLVTGVHGPKRFVVLIIP